MAEPGGLSQSILGRVELPPGPVVVALSGGADSAVLAWAAAEKGREARAIFVDHSLPHSRELKEAARAIAHQLDIEFEVVDAPVDRSSPSFEDTARRARYEALRIAAKPNRILTGHTADDQAETVLSHFLRGAGARGLAGIPAEQGMVARPLLAVTRAETRRLALELGLPFFDDPDNQANDLRRSRIRSQLIPLLEAEYNPQLRSALIRAAALSAADDSLLGWRAARIPIRFDGECVRVPAGVLHRQALPDAIATRVLRRALAIIRGPHGGTHGEIEQLLRVVSREARTAELAGGLRAQREGPWLTIALPGPGPVDTMAVSIPFSVHFDRWHLRSTESVPGPLLGGSGVLVLDRDVVADGLALVPAARGGTIDIGTGSKAVAVALGEAGVPSRLRDRWPVLWADDRVVGIPGVRPAGWARATAKTTRYLVVSMELVAPSE